MKRSVHGTWKDSVKIQYKFANAKINWRDSARLDHTSLHFKHVIS